MPPGIHSCHELVLPKSKCLLTYGPRFGKIKIVDHTLVKPNLLTTLWSNKNCRPHFGQFQLAAEISSHQKEGRQLSFTKKSVVIKRKVVSPHQSGKVHTSVIHFPVCPGNLDQKM